MSAVVTTPGRMRIVGIGAALVAIVIVFGIATSQRSRPFSIRDTGPSGYAALERILTRSGAQVNEIDASDISSVSTGSLLVPLGAGLTSVQMAALEAAATRGVTVVRMGDQAQLVVIDPTMLGEVRTRPPRTCDLQELAKISDLGDIETGGLFPVTAATDDQRCFSAVRGELDEAETTRGAMVVGRTLGTGRFITTAGPELFANDVMRAKNQPADIVTTTSPSDNSVVAVGLLLSGDDPTVTVVSSGVAAVVPTDGSASDDGSLVGAMSTGARFAVLQLMVALVLFGLANVRRFGRVIIDRQPVSIEGSELVAATAGLMMRRRDPGRAGQVIRHEMSARIGSDLGLGPDVSLAMLVPAVAARSSRSIAEVGAVLGGPPVVSEAALTQLVTSLDQLHKELLQ